MTSLSLKKLKPKKYLNLGLTVFALFLITLLVLNKTSNFLPTLSSNSKNDVASSHLSNKIWFINSIDTMKQSRDRSRDLSVKLEIPQLVKSVADLGANHIAIGTPYDKEFWPILQVWVQEARKNNLHVWFRGNLSGWESWFAYPKLSSLNDHHQQIFSFINSNPDLFEKGDIFTSTPEPENGLIGDPRQSAEKADLFNQFLIDSYDNCQKVFKQINREVQCGYFSVNGDVAKQVLTPKTVQRTGGVVVIDHYTKSVSQLKKDLEFLIKKFDSPVIIGEFGAPIENLNGSMNQTAQANFIDDYLQTVFEQGLNVWGVNYWVIKDGSTALIDQDNNPNEVINVIKKFFYPQKITGYVVDEFGKSITGVKIQSFDSTFTKSRLDGNFQIAFPNGKYEIKFYHPNYKFQAKKITISQKDVFLGKIILKSQSQDWFYKLKLFMHYLTIKLKFDK